MITYSWSFPTLDVVYAEGDLQNVVKTVHWRRKAEDGSYVAESYGTAAMAEPGQPFTEYADLTAEIVAGWVEAALGEEQMAAMDAALAANIDAQKNPVQGSMAPPWAANPEG